MGLFIKRGSSLIPVGSMMKRGAITDLTGTTWVIDASPDIQEYNDYSINYTSNNVQFSTFEIYWEPGGGSGYGQHYTLNYNDVRAYYDDNWLSQNYRTIEITGGADATNSNLISWLTSNATLTAGAFKRVSMDITYATAPTLAAPVIQLG